MTTNPLEQSSPSLTNSSSTTAKSFFHKLTSPLRQRTRNLTEFHIKPKDPHRRYSPGDLVEGVVVLKVIKPIRVTHITVALHGFVHVFKSANATTELTNNESQYLQSGNAKKSQYFGNGHASLFQDEVTLCGEGRVEPGVYEFAFELEFPQRSLPSSIDFERGTISYQIRATITRPTSIAPVTTCDRKVNLVESVDVGLMTTPRPRTISLEPILKRGRRTRAVRHNQLNPEDTVKSDELGRSNSPIAESTSEVDSTYQSAPLSPRFNSDGEQSERSAGSVVSGSTGTDFRIAPASTFKSDRASRQSNGSASEKTIYAKIELLKAGCLPGDHLSIKINIQHTKPIRSMHGIIITLYRQCRIDSAPPLEMFKDLTGKAAEKMKHEEYYPKSKTGLGGLSLSSAGSSSTFRKDLSQSFAPIIIDPITLSTEVPATIRVPEDVFPTITGTPAQMIAFRYFVEVIVDLGGKLAGQERHVARMGVINVPNNFMERSGRSEGGANMLSATNNSIVETEYVRREKSVVTSQFEVVVGTKDSQREVRRRAATLSRNHTQEVIPQHSQTFSEIRAQYDEEHEDAYAHDSHESPYPYTNGDYYGNEDSYHEEGYHADAPPDHESHGHALSHTASTMHVPAPETTNENDLTEKDRIRQAEQRLLPSQPPDLEAGPSSLQHQFAPSAPAYVDENDAVPDYIQATSSRAPLATSASYHRPSAHANQRDGPSVPPAVDIDGGEPLRTRVDTNVASSSSANIGDDKHELERRRLMNEASSPNDFQDDTDVDENATPLAPTAPSAPMLGDEDDYDYEQSIAGQASIGTSSAQASSSNAARRSSEHLPRYER